MLQSALLSAFPQNTHRLFHVPTIAPARQLLRNSAPFVPVYSLLPHNNIVFLRTERPRLQVVTQLVDPPAHAGADGTTVLCS